MEKLYTAMKNNDTNIHTEPTNRLSQRPLAVKSGEGVGFQAFEPSFGVSKSNTTVKKYGNPSKSKFKPATARPQPSSLLSAPFHDALGSSDDELLLSQGSNAGDATPPSKHVSKGKSRAQNASEQKTVRVNGRDLPWHQDFKPTSVLQGLKFTKKKSTPVDETALEEPPPSSSLPDPDSLDLTKPISRGLPLGGDISKDGPSSRRNMPSRMPSTRQRDVSPPRSNGTTDRRGQKPSTVNQAQSSIVKSSENAQPAVKPRPKPRLVTKAASGNRLDNLNATSRSPGKHDLALRAKSPVAMDRNAKRDLKRTSATSSARRLPQELQMPRRAKENVSDGTASTDAGRKGKASRAPPSVNTSPRVSLPFPLGNKDKPLERQDTFPVLSPLSSPVHHPETPRGKGKARAKPAAEVPGRGVARPFPMSSHVLASIEPHSSMSPIGSPTPTKRTSDDSDADWGRRAKKRKDSIPGAFENLDYLGEPPIEEDSIDIGYAKDPATICPYCDEDLPSHPTPTLQNLLTTARRKSYADPRPRNPRGLKASLAIYISVCQRHRFETYHLPIAIERGWPRSIDFTKVPGRVERMKAELEAIILDNSDCDDGDEDDIDDITRGPRGRSVFWREVKKEVRKQGSRTVVGVKGQFASFEKTQPGYYGEQGSNIIHQTLFNLFPPSSFDASLIAPLAPAEFIQRILVPEAAVRLIAQDLCADIDDAVTTLRESAQYGVAMFPDTGVGDGKRRDADIDDDEMGVADQIVMERARVRRRELEQEEKIEAEMMKEEEVAKKVRARIARREQAIERAEKARRTKLTSEDSSHSEASPPRRTARQRTVMADTGSDAMSVDSSTSRRSTRSARMSSQTDQKRTRAPLSGSVHSDSSDSVEVVRFEPRATGAPTRRGRTRGIETEAVNTRVGERPKVVSSTPLVDIGDSTPRPLRQRNKTPQGTTTFLQTGPSDDLATGSTARKHPLQIARSRGVTSASNNGWHNNLRDNEHSDSSHTSRRSQRLVRPPQKAGNANSWLLSQSPSSSE